MVKFAQGSDAAPPIGAVIVVCMPISFYLPGEVDSEGGEDGVFEVTAEARVQIEERFGLGFVLCIHFGIESEENLWTTVSARAANKGHKHTIHET